MSGAAMQATAQAQAITVWVEGIGVVGPGLDNWQQAAPLLSGNTQALAERTRIPAPETLPPAERRRAGLAVKATLAAGNQALKATGTSTRELATVFTSSGGDGVNCHEICAALARSERVISPTRFHNSVHNAPSGYWSISSGDMAPSSVLCAYDGSFAAGLLEAMAQVVAQQRTVLLVAYDTEYPEPLFGLRPIPDTMAVGLLLAPRPSSAALASLVLDPANAFTRSPAQTMADPVLEQVRARIPAARCLPLLRALAMGGEHGVVIDYLDELQLAVRTAPC